MSKWKAHAIRKAKRELHLVSEAEIDRARRRDEAAVANSTDLAYCPRCEQIVRTIDDGETCGQCKLVL
jgi:hypothetical protein